MRRILALILCLILIQALPGYAREGYWETGAATDVSCPGDRDGCMLLQMVMMGSFSQLNTEDNLHKRIMSAALSPLREVTDADIRHFAEEFGEDEMLVRELYFTALSNCLWADILMNPSEGDEKAARTVMLLFIDPDSVLDGEAQMDHIRGELDDGVIQIIAEAGDMPVEYVRYLLLGEIVIPEETTANEDGYADSPHDDDDSDDDDDDDDADDD